MLLKIYNLGNKPLKCVYISNTRMYIYITYTMEIYIMGKIFDSTVYQSGLDTALVF